MGMVLDYLEEVVLGVFKDHEDAFVFEDDFDEVDHIRVGEFGAEGHFSAGGLGYASVLDYFAFFVGFESVYEVSIIRFSNRVNQPSFSGVMYRDRATMCKRGYYIGTGYFLIANSPLCPS